MTSPDPLQSAHIPPAQPRRLVCHPATPCPLPLQLSVSLAAAGAQAGASLLLRYRVEGDVQRLRIPQPVPPGPADDLWRHTCFEFFVARADAAAYQEFNFSPSGQWAAYGFSQQRVRAPVGAAVASVGKYAEPQLELTASPSALTLQVCLPWQLLPKSDHGQYLQIGLTAVIETRDGHLSYWALHHPADHPDFHHRGGFVLPFDLASEPCP